MAAIQFVRDKWWDIPHPIHFVICSARDELSKNKRPRVRLMIKVPDLTDRITKLARSRPIRRN